MTEPRTAMSEPTEMESHVAMLRAEMQRARDAYHAAVRELCQREGHVWEPGWDGWHMPTKTLNRRVHVRPCGREDCDEFEVTEGWRMEGP